MPEPIDIQDVLSEDKIEDASQVLKFLVKTTKTFKIYLQNNPTRQKFTEELWKKFTTFINEYTELPLKIDSCDIYLGDATIYHNDNKLESLAFQLYVDSVRVLTFHKGLLKSELEYFLVILSTDYSNKESDDFRTLFWNSNFKHITCLFDDSFFDNAEITKTEEQEKTLSISADAIISKELSSSDPVEQGFNVKSVMLTEEEIQRLNTLCAQERQKNPFEDLAYIISSILQVETQISEFKDLVQLTETLIVNLIQISRLKEAATLIKVYNKLMQTDTTNEEQKKIIAAQLAKTGQPEFISLLTEVFSRSEFEHYEEFSELLYALPVTVVPNLTNLLGTLDNIKLRRILCDALIVLGKHNLEPIIKKLHDERWYVVRNVIYVLGKIGNHEAINKIKQVMFHEDKRVRKEVLRAFIGETPNEDKNEIARIYLKDQESEIRIEALRYVASRQDSKAMDFLITQAKGNDFNSKDPAEKKELLSAIATLGQDNALALFISLIKQKKWFGLKSNRNPETVLAVVNALTKIRTEQSKKILQDLSKDNDKTISNASIKALRELQKKP